MTGNNPWAKVSQTIEQRKAGLTGTQTPQITQNRVAAIQPLPLSPPEATNTPPEVASVSTDTGNTYRIDPSTGKPYTNPLVKPSGAFTDTDTYKSFLGQAAKSAISPASRADAARRLLVINYTTNPTADNLAALKANDASYTQALADYYLEQGWESDIASATARAQGVVNEEERVLAANTPIYAAKQKGYDPLQAGGATDTQAEQSAQAATEAENQRVAAWVSGNAKTSTTTESAKATPRTESFKIPKAATPATKAPNPPLGGGRRVGPYYTSGGQVSRHRI